jgi:hypothetical protein
MKKLDHSFSVICITLIFGGLLGWGIGMSFMDFLLMAQEKSHSMNPWGLKTDPAMGLVFANCGNCHSPYLITHHHRSREDWKKTIIKMESNGMTPPPDMIRKMLLDYLEKHQGPVKEDRPKESPWGNAAFDANPLW